MPTPSPSISEHYTRADLAGTIFAGLRAAGKDPATLTPVDLTQVDQFHIGARESTLALLRLAQLEPGQQVLDVGGGLGGPARTLALEAGVDVTVLDLTEAFVTTGALLTERTGLADRVRFRQGDATQLPFPDASFDAVWTQHSTMNIADKDSHYREAQRVLRPGGKLVFHEIMAGAEQPVYFPVPWASRPGISFLSTPAEVRALLRRLGWRERAWHDVTAAARDWWRERRMPALQSAPPPLGLHLLLGPDTRAMVSNLMRNLDEDRVAVVQAVLEHP